MFPLDLQVVQCKESVLHAGDMGSIPGLGRSPGEGDGNPRQYSCLENFMERGAWGATVHWGRKESDLTEHACIRSNIVFPDSLLQVFLKMLMEKPT